MREDWEHSEQLILAAWATKSAETRGRRKSEPPCPIRSDFQRDRDRILHCKAFRRLKHKTQVFINPRGDHFRTRLTHTLEVAQISRTIARALRLNEDLTEAIALGHDLGHTPFGHAGERALDRLCGPFEHNRQSLRLVEELEHDGAGLNLCYEVRDGIVNHTGSEEPQTLEGQVVRISDRVAYLNHDIDDALRAGLLDYRQLPSSTVQTLGNSHSARINTLVGDIIASSEGRPVIAISPRCGAAMDELRAFMFEHIYKHPSKLAEEQELSQRIERFYDYFRADPTRLPAEYQERPLRLALCDYISGMSDSYFLQQYAELFGA